MVNQNGLEDLRVEYNALEAENQRLRSKIPKWLAGDAIAADERPTPDARIAILSREQQVLMASLRIGEELVALRKSNQVLFRRGCDLQAENKSLGKENAPIVAVQTQTQIVPAKPVPLSETSHSNVKADTMVAASHHIPAVSVRTQAPMESSTQGYRPPAVASTLEISPPPQPQSKKKCTPEEKAERRELVASVLKAGLHQDVHKMSTFCPAAVPQAVPQEAGTRGRDDSFAGRSISGARNRESSHSAAVAESKYIRELAIRDMLRGISQN